MSPQLAARIKDRLTLKFQPNDPKFNSLYSELFRVFTDEFLKEIDILDLMENDDLVKQEARRIRIIDALLGDVLREQKFGTHTYPFKGIDGSDITLTFTYEKTKP